MTRYTIGPAFETYTPESFMAYVKSLRILPETKPDSKAAPGIKLSNTTKSGLRILSSRDQKLVAFDELIALAAEYKLEPDLLYATFDNRKWTITNQQGEQVNAKPKRTRTRKPSTAAKGDAHLEQNRLTSESADKLF